MRRAIVFIVGVFAVIVARGGVLSWGMVIVSLVAVACSTWLACGEHESK